MKYQISWLHRQKINVFVVTAGYTDCSYALTNFLKIPRRNVFANRLIFDAVGDGLSDWEASQINPHLPKPVFPKTVSEIKPIIAGLLLLVYNH